MTRLIEYPVADMDKPIYFSSYMLNKNNTQLR